MERGTLCDQDIEGKLEKWVDMFPCM